MFPTATPLILQTPATCELCGQWMPSHSSSCPRSGKHPSQWKLDDHALSATALDTLTVDAIEADTHGFTSCYNTNFNNQPQLWSQETDDVIPSSTASLSPPPTAFAITSILFY